MKATRRIITDNNTLRVCYQDLTAEDVYIGRLRLAQSEEYILLDLVDRGVRLFPSAVSQMASRSKTFQVLRLAQFMLPNTKAIHNIHDLMACMNNYNIQGVGQVVSKLDNQNGGLGIFLWASIEEVFTQASLGTLPYPFVIQPFEPNSRDIRVVILDDYVEAYWRNNPNNFRNNLHFGGNHQVCEPTPAQWQLCQQVMQRGNFPYAHIDLMVNASGMSYLAEINLRGGIRGARISASEYQLKIDAIHQRIRQEIEAEI